MPLTTRNEPPRAIIHAATPKPGDGDDRFDDDLDGEPPSPPPQSLELDRDGLGRRGGKLFHSRCSSSIRSRS